MSACTHATEDHRCRLPAVRHGRCLAHQAPAPHATTEPGTPTIRERVDRLIPELVAANPKLTQAAAVSRAWRQVFASLDIGDTP